MKFFVIWGRRLVKMQFISCKQKYGGSIERADYKLEIKRNIVARNWSNDARSTALLDKEPAHTLRRPEF